MGFAKATAGGENARVRSFSSFGDFMRKEGGDPTYGKVVRKQDWHEPVKRMADEARETAVRLAQENLSRAKEREAQRQLALQLISIGYKILAAQFHPDKKGGSKDAMVRLNTVRNRLKGCV